MDSIVQTASDLLTNHFGASPRTLAILRQKTAAFLMVEAFNTKRGTRDTTQTVTPTTEENRGLEVHPGRSYIEYDYYHIVGEVVNHTDTWYVFVNIVGTFYDAHGNVLGTDGTYIKQEALAPRGKGLFDLSFNIEGVSAQVASYKLQVVGKPAQEVPYTGLDIRPGRMYWKSGYLHLTGEVVNIGSKACQYTEVIVGFYDAEERLLAVDTTYTKLDTLLPNQSSPFQISEIVPRE